MIHCAAAALLLHGCTASEEITEPDSPLYRTAVQSALEEQSKGEAAGDNGQQAPRPAETRKGSAKDVSLLDFIKKDMASSAATSSVRTAYVYWTEDFAEFRRMPPRSPDARAGDDDYFVFWSGQDKKFMQTPLAGSEETRKQAAKGMGFVLSRLDPVWYVYWCDQCKAGHKQQWRLRKSPSLAPVEEVPTDAAASKSLRPEH